MVTNFEKKEERTYGIYTTVSLKEGQTKHFQLVQHVKDTTLINELTETKSGNFQLIQV